MAEATLPNVNPDGKKIVDDTEKVKEHVSDISSHTKESIVNEINGLERLKTIGNLLNDIQASLSEMLMFFQGRADIEDANRRFDQAQDAEDRAERQRAGAGKSSGQAKPVAIAKTDLPGLGGILGIPALAAIVTSIFGSDEYMRIPAYLTALGQSIRLFTKNLMNLPRRFAALSTLWERGTKTFSTFMGRLFTGGFFKPLVTSMSQSISGFIKSFTNQFRVAFDPKAGVWRNLTTGRFMQAPNAFVQTIVRIKDWFVSIGKMFAPVGKLFANITKGVGGFLAAIGKFLAPVKSLATGMLRLLGKLALPITLIFAVIDGITGFVKEFARTGSVLEGLKGAFTGIVEGFVNTLIDFVGGAISWLLSKLGLDSLAGFVDRLTEDFTNSVSQVANGVGDFIVGIFQFDGKKVLAGLGDVFQGTLGFFANILAAPIDAAVAFLNDIFEFRDEDAPPFSLVDLVTEKLGQVWEWLGELFDPQAILRALLPEVGSAASKLVPDALYRQAGINPETGEIETEQQRVTRESQATMDDAQEQINMLEESRSRLTEGHDQNIDRIEKTIELLKQQRETAPETGGFFTTTKSDIDEKIADRERELEVVRGNRQQVVSNLDERIAEQQNIRRSAANRITGFGDVPQGNGQPTVRVMTNDGLKDLTAEQVRQGREDGTIKRSLASEALLELGDQRQQSEAAGSTQSTPFDSLQAGDYITEDMLEYLPEDVMGGNLEPEHIEFMKREFIKRVPSVSVGSRELSTAQIISTVEDALSNVPGEKRGMDLGTTDTSVKADGKRGMDLGTTDTSVKADGKRGMEIPGQSQAVQVPSEESSDSIMDSLRAAMLQRESSGDYTDYNVYGYQGGYQFGAAALETIGYLKEGASKRGNSAMKNPENWTGKNGIKSLQDWLGAPMVQDMAFNELAAFNEKELRRLGVIDENTPPEQVAGYLAAAHLLGPGGVAEQGLGGKDAFGTSGQEYYDLGVAAASGAQPSADSAPMRIRITEGTEIAPPAAAPSATAAQDSTFKLAGMDFSGQMGFTEMYDKFYGGDGNLFSSEGLFSRNPLSGKSFEEAFALTTGRSIQEVDAAKEEIYRRYQGPDDFSLMGKAVNNGSTSVAAAREDRMGGSAAVVSAPTDNSTNVTNISNQTHVNSASPRATEPTIMSTINCGYGTSFG